MSMPASSVALTERSWMLRFCATAAMPAVRQPASPTSTYSTGVASIAQLRKIQLRSVKATLEGSMDIQGILGIDSDVRNGFNDIKVNFEIDADASKEDLEALVAQSQKRSAVYDVITNPTNVSVSTTKKSLN